MKGMGYFTQPMRDTIIISRSLCCMNIARDEKMTDESKS